MAFVHIEKAAGTTLIHVLRINFFMRYCDVKPLSSASMRIFRAGDLRKIMTINPALKCISGHAVKPFADLDQIVPQIRYITLLRDPVNRYISHYQYWLEEIGNKVSFEEFLSLTHTSNFQTKKIAGIDDIQSAKDILANRFFLVGIVEEFDQFLILLKKKLEPFNFRPEYQIQNVGNRESPIWVNYRQKMNEYQEKIIERNQSDIELYRYVKEQLNPSEKERYGPGFENDVKAFQKTNKSPSNRLLRYTDYVLRKCYYGPILGSIRKLNGLPPKGSY